MCGIIGIVSTKNIIQNIVEGLKRLEYRGYDSAGVASTNGKKIEQIRAIGKIVELEQAVNKSKLESQIAIGHTRWATHGKPSEHNAHPHLSYNGDIAVVHNGIIENYKEIKEFLTKEGYEFKSETDTEMIPNLIEYHLRKGKEKKEAVLDATIELKGSFAIAVIFKDSTKELWCAKKGSPLLIGYGQDEMYVASGFCALSKFTKKISSLNDDDIAVITKDNVKVFDKKGKEVKRDIKTIEDADGESCKGTYPHFMLKEIFEQPQVIERTLTEYVDKNTLKINLPKFPFDLSKVKRVTIVACGTSYYAGCVAKYIIESIAKVNVDIDIASEFRYRQTPLKKGNAAIFISQSGETADTLAALKYCKEHGQQILSIVNVANSSIAFLSDTIIKTMAGSEIGVASTKAFTAQVALLSLFALELAKARREIGEKESRAIVKSLYDLPKYINMMLNEKTLEQIKNVSKDFARRQCIISIGRGVSYPIAMESALKLKELTYIPTLAIAAGELKHGPLALVDKNMPVLAIAPYDELFEKMASNLQEVAAREGRIILISDKNGIKSLKKDIVASIETPTMENAIQSAIVNVIPAQLLAYYTAVYKGNDVDKPRNLAKSVTVE